MKADCGTLYWTTRSPYLEASATAGFAYGILKAVRKRYVGQDYAPVAEKAIRGIVQHISPEGELLHTSFGTGMGHNLDFYPQYPSNFHALRSGDGDAVSYRILA
ncbi:Predicted unsaturated glucuronyl hydrolase involved in regulation of bacterial surface properties, and related proteins [Citrobacter freundii]|nr:Predicted unsaturated glucuronyl hydrolase involved in regulation of bacterial surface properties, and related proteins [Citrobacter freundii]